MRSTTASRPLLARLPALRHVVVSGGEGVSGRRHFASLLAEASRAPSPPTRRATIRLFWLYSSGSTGAPKGAVHLQSHLVLTSELYAKPILGIEESDLVYSAAKLFFAYGLGNSLTFPMAVGATSLLLAERPTPAIVSRILAERRPTIFYGVPTLYAALLASADLPARDKVALRRCVSAGEALPEDIGRRWTRPVRRRDSRRARLDRDAAHLSPNRPGEVRYGSSGVPVPGYEIRLLDEEGRPVADGEIGELHVSGPTSAAMYWNNRERSRGTFLGPWTRSGDKYLRDARRAITPIAAVPTTC